MYKLTIAEKTYSCQPDETVLDALLRENVNIYACKKSTCHSCIVRSPDTIPPETVSGIEEYPKRHNHFLACLCHPEQDMVIKLPDQSEFYTEGVRLLLTRCSIEIRDHDLSRRVRI